MGKNRKTAEKNTLAHRKKLTYKQEQGKEQPGGLFLSHLRWRERREALAMKLREFCL